MKMILTIAAAAGALALGSVALAQEAKKPEAKPQAGQQHRGEHREHGGMSRMREMRGNCHGESRGEHNHS